MIDFPDWQAPQAHATAISTTGVPLLHLAQLLNKTASQAVAGGATVPLGTIAYIQPSYEIVVSASTTAAATIPFVRVKLTWRSSAASLATAIDSFIIPAALPGTTFTVRGYGPAKADTVLIQVQNLDPAVTATVALTMLESSRVFTRDVWTWNVAGLGAGVVPGFTLPTIPDDITCLGLLDNLTVAASTTVTYLFGLWDGLIQMAGSVITGTASNLSIPVRPQPDGQYATTAVTSSGSGNTINRQFCGARAPLRVDLINSATTALVVSLGLWAIR